jgi:hypothetical protein
VDYSFVRTFTLDFYQSPITAWTTWFAAKYLLLVEAASRAGLIALAVYLNEPLVT